MKNKLTIIAEAGVNHNGKLHLAKKMVDIAKKSGADYVKFQIYKSESLVIPSAQKASYQKKNLKNKNKENQFEMLKKYELSFDEHIKLISYCNSKKIKFLGSVFDVESLKFLMRYSNIIKIPSGEINNLSLIENIKGKNLRVIISTGISNLKEVKKIIQILLKNKLKRNNLTLLHCNSEYPSTKYNDLNLNVIKTYKKLFKTNVGYSDHTDTNIASIITLALGGNVIEKHFTINKNLNGPDHSSSLNIPELKKFVIDLKKAYISLGDGVKKPSKSEIKNLKFIRKSIYASKDILLGEKFSKNNISTKRPFKGLPAEMYFKLIGKKSKKRFKKDQLIKI